MDGLKGEKIAWDVHLLIFCLFMALTSFWVDPKDEYFMSCSAIYLL